MSLIVTEALVLHVLDYRETSRILRLATREAGVCSVIARGARRPRSRFGAALDLFAQGTAQLVTHPQRDLHTLAAFDVTRARTPLAATWGRFTAASALAELVMRVAEGEPQPHLFDAVERAFDAIAAAGGDAASGTGLAGAWSVLHELGFSPALDNCVRCDADLPHDAPADFVPSLGGVVCPSCVTQAPPGRRLPVAARDALRDWLDGRHTEPLAPAAVRAHQRLLREFMYAHLGDGRPLRALEVWEQGTS